MISCLWLGFVTQRPVMCSTFQAACWWVSGLTSKPQIALDGTRWVCECVKSASQHWRRRKSSAEHHYLSLKSAFFVFHWSQHSVLCFHISTPESFMSHLEETVAEQRRHRSVSTCSEGKMLVIDCRGTLRWSVDPPPSDRKPKGHLQAVLLCCCALSFFMSRVNLLPVLCSGIAGGEYIMCTAGRTKAVLVNRMRLADVKVCKAAGV